MAVPAIVVHGGAGSPPGGVVEDDPAAHAALRRALAAGWRALEARGALDAVAAAVALLEEEPLFNAGRGSVLNAGGEVECDAAIMDGRTRAAGAVAAVRGVRRPVEAARAVMERSPHVLLAGPGAERFARDAGVELVDPAWHVTDVQRGRWERWRERRGAVEPSLGTGGEPSLGTVGAVARDAAGHLAAATSTGGTRGKLAGRVGDSPLVGAGTFADDRSCAVSATGDGEQIVRAVAAHELAALVEHRALALDEACAEVVRRVAALGGEVGLIALGARGEPAMAANAALFNRAWRAGEGPVGSAIAAPRA